MNTWRQEVRAQLRLATPSIAIQLGMMAMGVVDTLMVGNQSSEALAALTLGNGYSFALMGFGMGVLMALDPIVAQAVGAGDREGTARGVQRGLVLAVFLSLPLALLILPARFYLTLAGQPEAIIPLAADYVHVISLSVLPFLLYVAMRHSLQSLRHLRPLLLATLGANLLNVGLDWAMIYGHLGFPAMGAVGSAWATVFCRCFMLAAVLWLAREILGPYLLPWRRDVLRWRPIARTLWLGLPIGVQMLAEISAFASVAIFLGNLGEERGALSVAGHAVAMNLASIAFMLPLGLSISAAVRVGNEVGAGDSPGARRAAAVALVGGALVMALTGSLFIALPGFLSGFYSGEAEVLAIAVVLVPLAGLFGVFDGIQVVSSGILRGIGDTRVPVLIYVLGFWGLGIPLGAWLCFGLGQGPTGMWIGLVAALGAIAVLVLWRVRSRLSRVLERVAIEEPAGHPPAS